jgi:isopentenyl-diphosphate Delta-isomerase
MSTKQVILVDTSDRERGAMEKMQAHREAELHRAFSIFIFNSKGEWLLQQRADHKYHSGGLWTNTCCSHPAPGEALNLSASWRLKEEMGLECQLHPLFSFVYRASLDHGLIEHEYDHVMAGLSDELPSINPEEVKDWRYVSYTDLSSDIADQPDKYTAWFRLAHQRVHNEFILNFAKWQQQLFSQ